MSFEENVEQLEKIVQELEKGDLNLDESHRARHPRQRRRHLWQCEARADELK